MSALIDALAFFVNSSYAAGDRVLLVIIEALRRRRRGGPRLLVGAHAHRSLDLHEAVHLLEALERDGQDVLRRALVRHSLLEVRVLQLAVLAGARHLRLGVLDLGLVVRELGLERGDRRLEVLNGRPEVAELVLRDGRLLLVLRELLHRRKVQEHLAAALLRRRAESRHGAGAAVHGHLLREARGLAEEVVGLVGVEEGDGLRDGLLLLVAGLGALLELRVGVRAALLEVQEERGVRREGVLRVRQVLLVRGVRLLRLRELLRLRVHHRRRRVDLLRLRSLEAREVLGGLLLVLLGVGQVRLERLLHLLQNAEDLAGRRSVRLEAGRLLQEGLDLGLLVRRQVRAAQRV